ncbi:hypothetical protein JW905_04095 [bacterium]|nr:hypothetical protein [candidate division CSSED10-310 bacterium]
MKVTGRIAWWNTPVMVMFMFALMLPGWSGDSAGPGADAELMLEDGAGDDVGLGGYLYPRDPLYTSGGLDLRRIRLHEKRDGLEVVVTLVDPISAPPPVMVGDNLRLDQVCRLGFYFQTIDIYFHRRGTAGCGSLLPGRNGRLAAGQSWDRVVVIHPQPGQFRSGLNAYFKKLKKSEEKRRREEMTGESMEALCFDPARVFVPDRPVMGGRELRVELPPSFLGGISEIDGILALSLGTSFTAGYRVNGSFQERWRDRLMVMGVGGMVDERRFAGAAFDGASPVMDTLGGAENGKNFSQTEGEPAVFTMRLLAPESVQAESVGGAAVESVSQARREYLPVLSQTREVLSIGVRDALVRKGDLFSMVDEQEQILGTCVIVRVMAEDGLALAAPVIWEGDPMAVKKVFRPE